MAHGRQACEYVKHEYVHFGFGFKSMALEKDTIYVVCLHTSMYHFEPAEPPKWLSTKSWDEQFLEHLNRFQRHKTAIQFGKLKTWLSHLSKLSLGTLESVRRRTLPLWLQKHLDIELARRTRPAFWSRFVQPILKVLPQLKAIIRELKSPLNPAGFSKSDSESQKVEKISAYIRKTLHSVGSATDFMVAESNMTVVSVEEETALQSMLASMIAYFILFGFSVMVREFFGLDEEDTTDTLLFIWLLN